MELVNAYYDHINNSSNIGNLTLEIGHLLRMLSPFAPHMTEELWHQLGNKDSICAQPWPKYDPELVKESELTIPVQVNGKLRDTIVVPTGTSEADIKTKAQESEKVKSFTEGKTVAKIIVVPQKLVNIVVK